MVGHGSKKRFPIFPDVIKADDIEVTLDLLETKLEGEATESPIIIVIGANHSGSFIPELSKPGTNRIIITSCDSEEIAYKGGLAPGGIIRQGDFFAWELFNQAAKVKSLKKTYEAASHNIFEYTENKNGNGFVGLNVGSGQYFDDSGQHPLFDDNGDGIGTFEKLSSLSGKDGTTAFDIFPAVNPEPDRLTLTDKTDTLVIEPGDTEPAFFIRQF